MSLPKTQIGGYFLGYMRKEKVFKGLVSKLVCFCMEADMSKF
jgi:hypothetical protein